jgi:cytochrome c-type biogenesis protein CcmE
MPEEPPQPRTRVFPVIVAGGILLLAVFVVRTSMSGGGSFALSVADLADSQSSYLGKKVKVESTIAEGSVRTGEDETDIFFDLRDESGKRVTVHYTRALPDPFKEGRSAIAEGVMAKASTIECSRLTVKCPSKYEREELSEEEVERYRFKHPDRAGGGN